MLSSNYLKQLDLQDIVIFLNMYEQLSARKTAETMNISQPTVSYCLKRLRSCFDDRLFTSSQGALVPTAKAEAIVPYLRNVVDSINRCAEYDSESNTGSVAKAWHICAPEYFELSILPFALYNIVKQSPKVILNLEKLMRQIPVDKLISGDIDLAIGFGPGYHQLHPDLEWESILTDTFICLTSCHRYDYTAPFSIDEFCSIPNVYPTPWLSEKNMVDSWLDKIGKSRNVLANANTYQAAINILDKVPATLALPKTLIKLLKIPDNVKICQPPHGFPSFSLDIIWASEKSNSNELTKLKDLIRMSAKHVIDDQLDA
ncbi:MAG: DNA-binding transcriptional LysR family regulator [Zhongshania aliphaticivorans]|jgi:DNA-binding transcriptional LysR family regulator|uniref:LysR family transcriptional regulator n=1 Tax=Zhongshania aliphaticivorans TaxID=1470434 RepID=A0A127M9W6_9GAMM|nr:LysR family transcriptional regulator [Zhongshania aliphaticivorans]AMO69975.1 LysR family transcriptional regulator [Zhongshania aliphaticivorans]